MRGSCLIWFVLPAALGSTAIGCGQGDGTDGIPIVPVGPEIHGLHTVGNHLEDNAGNSVVLRGVNRSGTEYMCVKGGAVFDGAWGRSAIAAIASWKANVIRIPLNESCWLGPQVGNGAGYKDSINLFISMLHQYHIVPIVELHWAAPGAMTADALATPMPDADHAVDFWTDVASTFANDDGVVFELYNEPFPDSNKDSTAAWQCWRDGCMSTLWVSNNNGGSMASTMTYQSVGMAGLLERRAHGGAEPSDSARRRAVLEHAVAVERVRAQRRQHRAGLARVQFQRLQGPGLLGWGAWRSGRDAAAGDDRAR